MAGSVAGAEHVDELVFLLRRAGVAALTSRFNEPALVPISLIRRTTQLNS